MLSFAEQLQDAAEFLEQAHNIVVLTGAGISTESGIPDFRSPGSIWQTDPPVSYPDFIHKPEARQRYWQTRKRLLPQVRMAQPNAAHHALVKLEQMGKLSAIITQNFDGLHQKAGNTPARILELHGTSHEAACTLCGDRSSIAELQGRIDAGEIDPRCPRCGGFLKAATILFGQRIPEPLLAQARAVIDTCDLFIVAGSSLKVTPASTLPRKALQRNIPLIILNLQKTSLDEQADVVIQGNIGDTFPAILNLLLNSQN